MFPIPWNKAFRKKDGSIVNIEDAMGGGGGGGYVLPVATSETLGGVKIGTSLKIEDGVLNNRNYISDAYNPTSRPIFKSGSTSGKYVTYLAEFPVEYPKDAYTPKFSLDQYNLEEAMPDPDLIYEFYEAMTEGLISDLDLVVLYDGSSSSTSVTLLDDFDKYAALVIQGCYNSGGSASTYDTTVIYPNIQIDTPYWFGVKDRNSTYCGTITFTDKTSGTVSASRTLKIWGIPKDE